MYPNNSGIQFYDPAQVATQFAQLNFGLGTPYDNLTTQVAQMTVSEIQNRANSGHPIRMGMFNIISQNAFNNGDFQYLLKVIILRTAYGAQAGEYQQLQVAFQDVIVRTVKACACGMASTDPAFVQSLPADDQTGVREGNDLWNYLCALADGQASFVAFSQMAMNNQFNNVNDATRNALEAARGIGSNVAGAFGGQSSMNYDVGNANGNNANPNVGRYGRRLAAMQGTLEGSMQNALAGAAMPNLNPPSRPAHQPRFSQAAVNKFDSDVTDFSKSINEPEQPVAAPTPAPAPVPETLFTIQLGEKMYQIVREHKDGGMSLWKPSVAQRFHPAWCKRTHTVRYFETNEGIIVVIAQELTEEQRNIAMDYKAHAVDPTKGQPEPNVPKAPVREEAKVLYSKEVQAKINVTVSEKITMVEDLNGSVRGARMTAEMSSPVPDVYVNKSAINVPLIYEFDTEAHDDKVVIAAIGASKTFAEAAKLMAQLNSPLARATIDKQLTHALNTACACELGVEVKITSFEEDGAAVIDVVEDAFGALYGEALRQKQGQILYTNVIVNAANDIPAYAESLLGLDADNEEDAKRLDKILFLNYNVMSAWTKYTDDELAIGVPAQGAAQIQDNTYGALYKVAKSIFDHVSDTSAYVEFYLVTKDGVRYRLHRSLISKNCFLISKQFKDID